jgi:hypothetical protein
MMGPPGLVLVDHDGVAGLVELRTIHIERLILLGVDGFGVAGNRGGDCHRGDRERHDEYRQDSEVSFHGGESVERGIGSWLRADAVSGRRRSPR